MTLGDILGVLRDAYCRTIGIEYMHIQDTEEKRWIQEQVEGVRAERLPDEQRHILGRLNAAEAFEKFLATKYVGQKRFGIEGAESAIPILDEMLSSAADEGLDGASSAWPTAAASTCCPTSWARATTRSFSEFEGTSTPTLHPGLRRREVPPRARPASTRAPAAPTSRSSWPPTPSHLEAVDPVVMGMVRAQAGPDRAARCVLGAAAADPRRRRVRRPGRRGRDARDERHPRLPVGGTIHLIINNQIGFTTAPESAAPSIYSTDVAKMVQAPIFHVNGDDPEACVRVALAFEYRQRFHKDVVIDMVCYRRHGHNEGDDPSYTQPLMYKARSTSTVGAQALHRVAGQAGRHHPRGGRAGARRLPGQAPGGARRDPLQAPRGPDGGREPPPPLGRAAPHRDRRRPRHARPDLPPQLSAYPEASRHPKLAAVRHPRKMFESTARSTGHSPRPWPSVRCCSRASTVRLAGQDSRRGTFSQRHATLVDYETGEPSIPLADRSTSGDRQLWIYDSLLSEYAALGFEYGYSVANPTRW
jgi:multifunctional 2-oxoglutarate metabolism enzyme